jgi:WD40 repeat protein
MATPVPSKPQAVQMIRFSPNSDRIAIGCQDAVVRVYDLAVRGISDEPFILRGHQLGITQIAFAPCGQWLVTGSQDNTVRLWNLTSPQAVQESTTLIGHIGWISALTIDPSGEYILSGSYDRTIRIWNVRQNRIATAVTAPPIILRSNLGIPESLALTRAGSKMIVQGSEGSLGIYHFPSLLGDDPEEHYRAVTFRNNRLSISKNILTTDDRLLIFSYEHLSNPSNNGIRLWALQATPSVR